jgi:hypothetical protein
MSLDFRSQRVEIKRSMPRRPTHLQIQRALLNQSCVIDEAIIRRVNDVLVINGKPEALAQEKLMRG